MKYFLCFLDFLLKNINIFTSKSVQVLKFLFLCYESRKSLAANGSQPLKSTYLKTVNQILAKT